MSPTRDRTTHSEPVTVRTCKDLQEAEIIRSVLDANGITAFIPDENVASLYPPQVLDTDGVRVQVAAEDLERAREALDHAADDDQDQKRST
jgi:putative signal transducing protein